MNELSPQGAAFIRRLEGFVDHWYADPVGIGTIGIGMTWRSAAFREWWGKNKTGQPFARGATMTRDQADDALKFLMQKEYGLAVRKFLGKDVAQNIYDAMCSVVYNCGPGSLKWKWATDIKAGHISEAASRLRGTAVTARGVRLAGLVRRRQEEAKLLEHGIYTGVTTPKPAPLPVDPMADGLLTRGEQGVAVMDMQKQLSALGYYKGVIDAQFGPGTEAAVLAFQKAHPPLKVDGIVGPNTAAALAKAIETQSAIVKTTVGGAAVGTTAGAAVAGFPWWQAILLAVLVAAVIVGFISLYKSFRKRKG